MTDPIAFEDIRRGHLFSIMWWYGQDVVLEQLCVKDEIRPHKFSVIATRANFISGEVSTYFADYVSVKRQNAELEYRKFEKERERQHYDIRCFEVDRETAKRWLMDWKSEQSSREIGRDVVDLCYRSWATIAHMKSEKREEMAKLAFEVDKEYRYPREDKYKG